jgi:hypothetical protein
MARVVQVVKPGKQFLRTEDLVGRMVEAVPAQIILLNKVKVRAEL